MGMLAVVPPNNSAVVCPTSHRSRRESVQRARVCALTGSTSDDLGRAIRAECETMHECRGTCRQSGSPGDVAEGRLRLVAGSGGIHVFDCRPSNDKTCLTAD